MEQAGSSARTRSAVVTGAASGIGRATAQRLLREGIDVLAVDRVGETLESLVEEGASILVADLADEVARETVCDAGAGVDYLVNAAGIMRVAPILDVTPTDWREVFAVNAEAVFFLCQRLGSRLRPGGAIVNVSSSSAKLATTVEVASYAASKAAVTSITRSFAYALAGLPVRVNAVLPGIIDTPMQDAVLAGVAAARGVPVDSLRDARNTSVPLGRAASAEECAGMIWFLLSDESAYMTGQSINFTGGLVTW
jgi:NAD(P)-dependent dehydrogenase (short-subunit alcohol dehydrogenase family)